MAKLPTIADLAPAERASLAALAHAEREAPCAAYDVVGDRHPLEHVVAAGRYASPTFDQALARRVVAELRSPSGKYGGSLETRRQLARACGLAEDSMPNFAGQVRRNYARDQEELPPRGGRNFQDPNGEMLDAATAQQQIQAIFDALDPSERQNMIASLAQFLDANAQGDPDLDGGMDQGLRNNNRSAMDARARARQAQDRALARERVEPFLTRFPMGGRVQVLG